MAKKKRQKNKRPLTQKEICNLVGYLTILIQNQGVSEVLSNEEIDIVLKKFTDVFGSDDQKAVKYYQELVLKLKGRLHD